MTSFQNEKLKQIFRQNNKPSTNNSLISRRNLQRVKSVHILRENKWNDRFIYNKIPEYDSYKDKNVKINLSTRKNNKNLSNLNSQNSMDNKINEEESPFDLNAPSTNKTNLKNGKRLNRIASAKRRDNNSNINLKYLNMINLNNINKLWDELCVSKSYRNLFCVIYKELNSEDKQKIYQKEINEIISIKNNINKLKLNIGKRLNIIEEISELNNQLYLERANNNNKEKGTNQKNENIINEISKKIETLREITIIICFSMKKIKYGLNGIKNLDKYDIDLLSEKFNFDKNYLIKMKSELNFLKEGFAKFYFNIENDQTPFLLNASQKIENNIPNNNYHIIPLKKDIENDIIECIFYIYQELIAYQNEKVNQKILKRISPLRRISKTQEDNNIKIINGKEENSNSNIYNNNKLILKKSSSVIGNLRLKLKNNKNFIYSKKKFLKIDKNGNNLLLNQYRSHRNDKNDRNISIGLKYNNPLTVKNKFLTNNSNKNKNNLSQKNNVINITTNDNNKKEEKKIIFRGLDKIAIENKNDNNTNNNKNSKNNI